MSRIFLQLSLIFYPSSPVNSKCFHLFIHISHVPSFNSFHFSLLLKDFHSWFYFSHFFSCTWSVLKLEIHFLLFSLAEFFHFTRECDKWLKFSFWWQQNKLTIRENLLFYFPVLCFLLFSFMFRICFGVCRAAKKNLDSPLFFLLFTDPLILVIVISFVDFRFMQISTMTIFHSIISNRWNCANYSCIWDFFAASQNAFPDPFSVVTKKFNSNSSPPTTKQTTTIQFSISLIFMFLPNFHLFRVIKFTQFLLSSPPTLSSFLLDNFANFPSVSSSQNPTKNKLTQLNSTLIVYGSFWSHQNERTLEQLKIKLSIIIIMRRITGKQQHWHQQSEEKFSV